MTPHSLTGLFNRLGLGFHFHFNFNIQPLFTSSSSPKQNPNSGGFEVFRPAVSPTQRCACGFDSFIHLRCVPAATSSSSVAAASSSSVAAVCFLRSSLCAFKYHEDL
ncbi:hypothetical protein SESBI_49821 [Sesbania bispinosa]|nr:hypothetical protein SESBI_49821 [Sesbania bispinosa]